MCTFAHTKFVRCMKQKIPSNTFFYICVLFIGNDDVWRSGNTSLNKEKNSTKNIVEYRRIFFVKPSKEPRLQAFNIATSKERLSSKPSLSEVLMFKFLDIFMQHLWCIVDTLKGEHTAPSRFNYNNWNSVLPYVYKYT